MQFDGLFDLARLAPKKEKPQSATIMRPSYVSQSLRDAVNRYHQRAEGKSLIDYAFHVILSDPSEKIMGQDFPALVADGKVGTEFVPNSW